MEEKNKYHRYTAKDIEKYLAGSLSHADMHALEKAALDDPFLADALDGYTISNIDITPELSALDERLQKRMDCERVVPINHLRRNISGRRIAAAVIILTALGITAILLSKTRKSNEIAVLTETDHQPAKRVSPDTTVSLQATQKIDSDSGQGSLAIDKSGTAKKQIHQEAVHSMKRDSIADAFSKPETVLNENAKTIPGNSGITSSRAIENETAAAENNYTQKFKGKIGSLESSSPKLNLFRGKITDANSNPLAFAKITNIRDSVGTYADAQGNFVLASPDSILDVQIRSLGFESTTARLRDNLSGNRVALDDDKAQADRVISYQPRDTSNLNPGNVKFEEPVPADGWPNYNTYIANNLVLPEEPAIKQPQGRVKLSFDVDQNGDPVNIKVERSLCKKCDEEAVRLIKQGPKWKRKNKKTKHVALTVPFDHNQ